MQLPTDSRGPPTSHRKVSCSHRASSPASAHSLPEWDTQAGAQVSKSILTPSRGWGCLSGPPGRPLSLQNPNGRGHPW